MNFMIRLYVKFYLTVTFNNMLLWGVAVLELDSHPDNNKGPDLHKK